MLYCIKWHESMDKLHLVWIKNKLTELGASGIHLGNQFGWDNQPEIPYFKYPESCINVLKNEFFIHHISSLKLI